METLRMDYRFTALLIVMLTLLALFGGPAHSRNEYLTNGTNSCRTGEVDVRKLKPNMIIVFQVPVIMIMIDTN